jgi:Domain of unknown function (DUF4136)
MTIILPLRATASMVLATVLLTACVTPPDTTYRSNYDKSANLAEYHTYAFAPDPGTNRAGYSPLLTGQFENAIRREMDARRYRYDASDPDLLINFNFNGKEKVDLSTNPTAAQATYYYGYRRDLYAPLNSNTSDTATARYKAGTANIDVVDARKKQLLWEGIAEGKLTREVMENPEAAVNAVVTKLFAQFPGQAR